MIITLYVIIIDLNTYVVLKDVGYLPIVITVSIKHLYIF